MRRLTMAVAAAALLGLMLGGCKTTEENYQRAYDIAKAKKTEGLTAEEISGFRREAETPKTVYKGDSIPLKAMYVSRVEGGADNRAMRYNVIVASFKQRFNAMSVFNRLKDGGYSNAVVLSDKDTRYYIGAVTTSSLDTAVAAMKTLQSASPVALQSGCPYILDKVR